MLHLVNDFVADLRIFQKMRSTAVQLPGQWDNIERLPAELFTAQQVRDFDAQAITAGTPGIVLMRRAARAVFTALLEHWPKASQVCVFCGSGNNAGDGYLVAQLAAERGLGVQVFELADSDRLQGDAAIARQSLVDSGTAPSAWQDADQPIKADIIVDALLGTGLKGELRPAYHAAITAINASGLPVIAVDIPSGIISDTGAKAGELAVVADVTVSFIGLKRGLLTGSAVDHVGRLSFANLDVDTADLHRSSRDAVWQLGQLASWFTHFPRRANSAYKNKSGHLLIIGGDYGMAGAPLLSAMAALRCGTGLVSVATRPEHISAVVSRAPDVMAVGIEKTAELEKLLARASAVVVGPGLGTGPWAQQLLQQLRELDMPVLIDADALNLISERDYFLPTGPRVLTPHSGEAARLLGADWDNNAVNNDRFACIETLRNRYGGSFVLKGAGSLVASEQSHMLCPYGNPAMATAGMGDILSGVIGALLAQGLAPNMAAELGVLLHAAAADQRVHLRGEHGLLASDMPQALQTLINSLLKHER